MKLSLDPAVTVPRNITRESLVLAYGHAWAREIRSGTGSFVELEMVEEPPADEIEIDAEGEIIAALCWRDPTLLWSAA